MTRRTAFGLAAILAATVATGAGAMTGILHHAPAAPAAVVTARPASVAHRPPALVIRDGAEPVEVDR